MKYLVILCDGMADHKDENGQTPMTMANKPNMDALAKISEAGLCKTIPTGMTPGSDTANLSVIGYDPRQYYTGRSPLEAISMGIQLTDSDITYRLNLVTLSNEEDFSDKTMLDYSAGEIETKDSRMIIDKLQPLVKNGLELYGGVSYRHCLVRRDGSLGAVLKPPHDITNQKIANYLPSGKYSDEILEFLKTANKFLADNNGFGTKANAVWLWGEGSKPLLTSFKEKFGKDGAVISAVDLIKGIGIGAKMQSIDVEGALGTIHTNFIGKANAAIKAFETNDYVYIHLEAPDECGHQGDKNGKVRSIELIDEKIVKPLYDYLKNQKDDFKILIIPDHATPLALRTHTSEPVPYLFYESAKAQVGVETYNEFSCIETGNFIGEGYLLAEKLFNS